jgi:hypothetical protein
LRKKSVLHQADTRVFAVAASCARILTDIGVPLWFAPSDSDAGKRVEGTTGNMRYKPRTSGRQCHAPGPKSKEETSLHSTKLIF